MSNHPILVPKAGQVAVRWLRAPDGRCYGKEFYDDTPACWASLLAQAKQIAIKGRVGKVPENGHPLQGEFTGITELKPGDYRFMGFRDGENFYITNGAPKKTKGKQKEDYRLAKKLRDSYRTPDHAPLSE